MQTKEIEIWLDIPNLPKYQASCLGDIRRKYDVNNKVKLYKDPNRGYLKVYLIDGDGKPSQKAVHYFIALTFLGVRPVGLEIDHIDGVKTNNRADNLEYVTHAENIRRATELGLQKPRVGSLNGMAKLTEKDVEEIRAHAANSSREAGRAGKRYYGRKELALKYGVSECTIKEVVVKRRNKFYNVS